MFPGHPYLLQETRRAEDHGQQKERERVLRLLREYKNKMRQDEDPWWDLVAELEQAVQQGWQRL